MIPETEILEHTKLIPIGECSRARLNPGKVNYFMLREGQRYSRILYSDIKFIHSRQNYLKIVTFDKEYLVVGTMKHMENILPADQFFRVHRSFIIPLSALERIERESVIVNGKAYPLGHEYRKRLLCAMQHIIFNSGGQG